MSTRASLLGGGPVAPNRTYQDTDSATVRIDLYFQGY